MAEESTRQVNLETACRGLRPTTGHNGCLMMMIQCSLCNFSTEVNAFCCASLLNSILKKRTHLDKIFL